MKSAYRTAVLPALLLASACVAPVPTADADRGRPEDTGADDTAEADDTADTADTADTDETGDTNDSGDPAVPLPWADPTFWTEPGPLAILVGSRPSAARYAVRIATSVDGVHYTDAGTIAWGLSSLHVLAVDGGLVLTGMVDPGLVLLSEATVYALATRDLTTFGSVAWPVAEAAEAMTVDAAPYVAADGRLGVVYFGTSEAGVDPATIPGPHAIRRAWWTEAGLVEEPAPLYSEDGLVDPCVCTLDGTEVLFATVADDGVRVATSTGGPFAAVDNGAALSGNTVPFCRADADGGALVTQLPSDEGPPPAFRWSADGMVTPAGTAADANPFDGPCTSPAILPWQDGWLMVCAIVM